MVLYDFPHSRFLAGESVGQIPYRSKMSVASVRRHGFGRTRIQQYRTGFNSRYSSLYQVPQYPGTY
jgi:hypothetical protein